MAMPFVERIVAAFPIIIFPSSLIASFTLMMETASNNLLKEIITDDNGEELLEVTVNNGKLTPPKSIVFIAELNLTFSSRFLLALAEMIASMKTPSVSLVLGDSHSIGVPLAVSTDYSFIAPTATMIVHPVRMNGTIIGAPQTFDYFQLIQDRIVHFIAGHSRVEKEKLEQMMINTGMLTKDLGTILVGKEAVRQGLIDEVGGISAALEKLRSLMAD